MTAKAQPRHYSAIDIAKFILAFFIVGAHADPMKYCTNQVILTLYRCLVQSAVPFFFLAAGFLLVKSAEAKSVDLRTAIHQQLVKTIKLYCIWHVIYLPLAIYHFYTNDYSVLRAVLVTIRAVLLVGKNFYSDILWYLLSTIYAFAFISLLLKRRLSVPCITACCVPVYLFGTFFNYIIRYGKRLSSLSYVLFKGIDFAFTSGRIFTGFLFIALGMLIAQKKPPIALSLTLLIGGFIANYHHEGIFRNLIVAVQAIGAFMVVSAIPLPPSPIYPYLRRTSTNIYFLHQWVMFVFCFIAGDIYWRGPDIFFGTLSVTLVLSCIWIFFQNRSRNRIKRSS